MEPLIGSSSLDDGKFKKGVRVPKDAVGIAWSESPSLTPQDNVIVIDMANTTPENSNIEFSKKVMYANELGILEDEFGNEVIQDEFPIVGDVFSIEEDFSLLPGSEYKPEHILPFIHVSRFFHVDHAGLSIGTQLEPYNAKVIRVVNSTGNDYVDSNGDRKYKAFIASATQTVSENSTISAYRLHIFIDSVDNEDLYLEYNKCELDENGLIINTDINHREILNPRKHFAYTTEESDVVDAIALQEKLYSTKPTNIKEQIIGVSRSGSDGYRVYVPKKAIPDSRIFQLFRWRLNCSFVNEYKVDPVRESKVIKCGVLVTNSQKVSDAPYAFYNLQESAYNAAGISFVNPLNSSDLTSTAVQTTRDYWQVNLDSLCSLSSAAKNDLAKFDVLLLCLPTASFDLTKYIPAIDYFTKTLGRTLIIDTNNKTYYKGLGVDMTSGVTPSGNNTTWGLPSGWADMRTQSFNADWSSASDEIFNTLDTLGGWTFYDDDGYNEFRSISPYYRGVAFANWRQQPLVGVYKTQRFSWTAGTGFRTLITAESNRPDSERMPVLVSKKQGPKGSIYASSCGTFSQVSQLFDPLTGQIRWYNANASIVKTKTLSGRDYESYLNTHNAEGGYKMLYNICLMAVRNNVLNNSDEYNYSSSWLVSTPWKGSWVIDASDDVLSDEEIITNNFSLMQASESDSSMVWKRKIAPQKTAKQLIDEILTPEQIARVAAAKRIYSIEITNDNVDVQDGILDESNLYAWTTAYTPKFEVPAELGPHIIKDDNVLGDYSNAQASQINYPPKPFKAQIKASFSQTAQTAITKTVHWTATATATKTTRVKKGGGTVDATLSWVRDGSNSFFTSSRSHENGLSVPVGLSTWQDENYSGNKWGAAPLNWPSFGINARLTIGSTGEFVSFLQDALNGFSLFGIFNMPGGQIPVTGSFDNRTEAAVLAFQDEVGARFVDGVVDAETWFLVGNKILKLGAFVRYDLAGYKRFYGWPAANMMKQNVSNELYTTGFLKRSNIKNPPPFIWDMFRIQFEDEYDIHGITVVPFLPGGSKDMMVRSIDVRTSPFTLSNYDPKSARLKGLKYRPKNNQELYIPFGPYRGDTLIVGIGQDKPANSSGFRELGVKDIVAHAASTAGGGKVFQEEVTINITGTATVRSTTPTFIKPKIPAQSGSTLSNITWTSVELSGDESTGVYATIETDGVIKLRHQEVITVNTDQDGTDGENTVTGRIVPMRSSSKMLQGDYTMDTSGRLIPGKNTGFISKSDGIRLFCDSLKRPVGFPSLLSNVANHEGQIHYSILSVSALNADPSVKVGFYDFNTKEFIADINGSSDMSYIEYMTRGPKNIFIGVVCDFEQLGEQPIPTTLDAPTIPYKWAMPVYGIFTEASSQIKVEPIKSAFGPTDMWSLPIRTGKFTRSVKIPSRNSNPYSGYLAQYQGRDLSAVYSVPEAGRANWSSMYGRPFIDVVGEHPEIVDQNTIQLASYPMLMVKQPTIEPDDADPVTPVFSIYTRESTADAWVKIQWSGIDDYNVSTGTIYLTDDLASTDPNLIKVDYTSANSLFQYNGYANNKLFLNPYVSFGKENIGKPIYIYMYPQFVKIHTKEEGWKIIEDSVRDRTIFWTTEPSSFSDPLDPLYDPMIVELAVVYVTNSVDIRDVSLIDIRKRGGGLKDETTIEEAKGYNPEFKYNWDLDYAYGTPYQAGGFVVIRLPASLKNRFPNEQDIIDVIERNIPAGIRYKIEDTDGNNWN